MLVGGPASLGPGGGPYPAPGGALIFLVNSALLTLCMPEEDDLARERPLPRPAFGMYRIEWPGDTGVEFHLSHGDWPDCSGAAGSRLRT